MDIWILLWNQVHSRLQTSFLSLSSKTLGSAPALSSKPDAGSTEDVQWSQDRFERLWEMWLTFWQARQDSCCLSTEVFSAPVLSIRLNKAGHWDLSSQRYQQLWKGLSWLISSKSIISISTVEIVSMGDWQKWFTPEWRKWAWSGLSTSSAPGRQKGSRWAANSCFQRWILSRLMQGLG